MIGIYKITNKENGRVYIGQSINIEKRIKRHKRDMKNGKEKPKSLQNDYDSSPDSFEFSVLCECSIDELDGLENFYIAAEKSTNPKNVYNIKRGGNWCTRTVTIETRRKISEKVSGENSPNYGKRPSKEALALRSESMKKHSDEISKRMKGRFSGEKHPFYGKHHTAESREKMSKALAGHTPWMAGKHHTEESLKRISDGRKGKMVGASNHKSKAVICVETGKVYESQRIASRYLSINQSEISRSCNTGKPTKGLHFQFAT